VSEYSSSDTALRAMRAGLRKIAQNLLSTFCEDRSGNIGPKLTICEAHGPKRREKQGRNEQPKGSSRDRQTFSDRWNS
jgi:hypothetical protein